MAGRSVLAIVRATAARAFERTSAAAAMPNARSTNSGRTNAAASAHQPAPGALRARTQRRTRARDAQSHAAEHSNVSIPENAYNRMRSSTAKATAPVNANTAKPMARTPEGSVTPEPACVAALAFAMASEFVSAFVSGSGSTRVSGLGGASVASSNAQRPQPRMASIVASRPRAAAARCGGTRAHVVAVKIHSHTGLVAAAASTRSPRLKTGPCPAAAFSAMRK